MPRTKARPIEDPTERTTDLTAASVTVCRFDVRGAGALRVRLVGAGVLPKSGNVHPPPPPPPQPPPQLLDPLSPQPESLLLSALVLVQAEPPLEWPLPEMESLLALPLLLLLPVSLWPAFSCAYCATQ